MTEYREFGFAEPYLRALVVVGCAFEIVAITAGHFGNHALARKIPTVSRICRENPLAKKAVMAVLDKHFEPLNK